MPFPANTPTPDDLSELSVQDIAQMPVELLAILQHEIDARLKRDKAAKTRFDGALSVRYADRAAEERQVAGKDTGTVRLADGEYTVVADLPKRVQWDQAQLAAVVAQIRAAGNDPTQYVDIAIKVPPLFPEARLTHDRRALRCADLSGRPSSGDGSCIIHLDGPYAGWGFDFATGERAGPVDLIYHGTGLTEARSRPVNPVRVSGTVFSGTPVGVTDSFQEAN